MAHIVCLTSGLTGILHASFELVARLQAEGHRVTYGTPRAVAERVAAQGIDYVQLPPIASDPAPPLPTLHRPLRRLKRLWYQLRHARQRRQTAFDKLNSEDIAEKLQALQPELLIIDVELHEYILTAFGQRTPLLLLSQWFSLWKRPGLPYLLHDTVPGRGWRGQPLAIRWAWWQVRLQRWYQFQKKWWRSLGCNRRTVLRQLARKVGFPMRYIRSNYWPGPFTYDELPVISMTAAEMEFPHPHRPNLHYVGPMVSAGRQESRKDQESEQRLERLFEQKRRTGAALIYCSVSTLHKGDEQFLQNISQAVAGREDWILILGLGGLLDTAFLEPLPTNVHPFSWVPQLKVLEQADCSINHGGIHTINECLHFRVPMLVYSGKRSDQNGCAARVDYHQLGIMADKDTDTAADIRSKIEAVLSTPKYVANMDTMHGHYQAYKGQRKLEEVVRVCLASGQNQGLILA
ncbi:MAG: nucleotide disphospho-sugar-binding domain-containing protein [Bacteroidota bacterium]